MPRDITLLLDITLKVKSLWCPIQMLAIFVLSLINVIQVFLSVNNHSEEAAFALLWRKKFLRSA